MMRSVARRVEDGGCTATRLVGAAVDGPADLRVFALGVLAHEDDVDGLSFSASGVATPGKSTVGRTFAYCSKARRMGRSRPLRVVVWSGPLGVSHRTQVDRVEAAQPRERVVRHSCRPRSR
jgi:hypothetical protein